MTDSPIALFFKHSCIRCGALFEPPRKGRRKYCDACAGIVENEQQLTYWRTHRKSQSSVVKLCLKCGKALPPTPGYPYSLKTYCDPCRILGVRESQARRRAVVRHARGLDKTVTKPCVRCGKDMLLLASRAEKRKYCTECRLVVDREVVKASARLQAREGRQPVGIINCVDCGKDVLALSKRQIRCDECRLVNAQVFYAIRELRSAIYNKAIVDPADARKFVVQMIAEEGLDFKQYAIDGIVERVIVDRVIVDRRKVNEYLKPDDKGGWTKDDETQTKPDDPTWCPDSREGKHYFSGADALGVMARVKVGLSQDENRPDIIRCIYCGKKSPQSADYKEEP